MREFLERIKKEYSETLVGVILFGSVARGEADRASDIDIQVIVETEKLPVQRTLQKLRKEIQNRRFSGDRYRIQVMFESTDSVENYGEKLQEIVTEGIVLYSTNRLDELKEVVLDGR